jgi:hypothetical protein
MMRFLLLFLFAAGSLAAHPHSNVDQQALLSIGLDHASLSIRIVPSDNEGGAILNHIDKNGDGAVSQAEAKRFGQDVVSDVQLAIDGAEVAIGRLTVLIPESTAIVSGTGMIEINAEARYNRLQSKAHQIEFSISYEDFSHDWFIQPFFFENLPNTYANQSIMRSQDGLSVRVGLE